MPGDPFDPDDIRFSSDDDIEGDKTIATDQSAASLLAAFKSRQAHLKQQTNLPAAIPAPDTHTDNDFDNDSIVDFDNNSYENETFDEFNGNSANDEPDQPAAQQGVPVPAPITTNESRPEFSSMRRPRSLLETLSQLRSRSNSSRNLLSPDSSPPRNDVNSTLNEQSYSLFQNRLLNSKIEEDAAALNFQTGTQPTNAVDAVQPNSINKKEIGGSGSAFAASGAANATDDTGIRQFTDRAGGDFLSNMDGFPGQNIDDDLSSFDSGAVSAQAAVESRIDEQFPESIPRSSIPIPNPSMTLSVDMSSMQISDKKDISSTTTLINQPERPPSNLPPDATSTQNVSQYVDRNANMGWDCGDHHCNDSATRVNQSSNSPRSESVSPTRSAATACDSNADFDKHPSGLADRPTKSEDDPVECSSPNRRKPKKSALRHIKRKLDISKRRQNHHGDVTSVRTESAERKRFEKMQVEQEERLKKLERDKFLLESQVNQLSVSVSGSFRERLAAGAPLPDKVNDTELEGIKKEMQTMEKIIEALNEENAKLYASLRGEQISLKGTAQQMLARNKSLRAELDLAKTEIEELKREKLTTADESAQEEIRRLKHSMVQQRNDSEAKLRAAQSQIDSLRRHNEELEYRLSTINYEPVSPRRLRPGTPNKSKVTADKNEKEIAELREKLQWYIENQKMIDDLQQTIKQKDESIQTLQHRVNLLYAETKNGKRKSGSAGPTSTDNKRIRELENEIVLLKKQQPHKRAVSVLVKAANRPDQRTFEQLQKTVDELQQELAAKDADYMARMRSLRQECDKLRIQYEERLNQLQSDRREQAQPHERIRELEEQIEDMRETYRRKGHNLKRSTTNASTQTETFRHKEDREDEYRSDGESRQLWHQIKKAEDQNRRYRERIEELEAELAKEPSRQESDFDSVIAAINEAHAAQISALHGEIRRLSDSLRKNPEAILDRSATSHLVASLQSQLDVANRENISLKEKLIETQYELSRLRSMPTHVQINALEMKLNEIESRHATREANLREALRSLEQQAEVRSNQSTARYETMVREKNAQIAQFKTELDALLSELIRIQRRSTR